MRKGPCLFSLLSIFIIISGCLEEEGTGEGGFSAFKHRPTVELREEQTGRELVLVAVTAVDPTGGGRATSWKFSYNDETSGFPLNSYSFTVNEQVEVEEDMGDPLSKTPIRNWTIDSTSAFSRAKGAMKEKELINDANVIEVDYIYLLGESGDNSGCEWYIGTRPYEGDAAEVHIVIDGNTGGVISLSKSKF